MNSARRVGAILRRPDRAGVVYALLVGLTCVAWLAGGVEAGLGSGGGRRVIGVGILLIAVGKARLVGRHFMEIQTAPAWLRWAFDGYCVALLVLLCVLFLVG
ncbi:cytochrome C oxidase subunit IV family protein [uncultured Jatrophihabitans sp.]|uniref:cytochrome C oxidase subunit IV family protein n=1 Tax=uncultured Jatrophihabitans sp. TaxID=1610747 RepID=UPI0035CA3A33